MAHEDGEIVAGVDLGSNSFHMVVARMQQRQLHVFDRVREWVRLGANLDERRRLTKNGQRNALQCLERFNERLDGIAPERVRAVGTNTLRQARNGREFLEEAGEALGHTIEVISGLEEARLIYLGVAHSLADDVGQRLVIDIGGGSTECILGERFEPQHRDSLYMGCVSYTQRFFADGSITAAAFERAESAALRELQSISQRYSHLGWRSCIGSSGTLRAIERVGRAAGWSESGITRKSLRKLHKAMISDGQIEELEMSGLEPERVPVFPGGVAIASAVFDSLGIEKMTTTSGALREGLIYDLVGRIHHEDVRDKTIQGFCADYHIDIEHATRVERTALELLDQVGLGWGVDGNAARRFIIWAAQLHQIGLSVSYTGYHKHSAYIVANADMPGFSRDDQQLLAALIRNHRRKISRSTFAAAAAMRTKAALRLCILLRLAVCLNRARNPDPLPPITLTVKKDRFKLDFPRKWLEKHPLTAEDLKDEATRLRSVGMELCFS